jgi:hypothetical protein
MRISPRPRYVKKMIHKVILSKQVVQLKGGTARIKDSKQIMKMKFIGS